MTMHDPHADTDRQPVFRQSWREVNPRYIIAAVVAEEPDWDETAVRAECWTRATAGWEFIGGGVSRPGNAGQYEAEYGLLYSIFCFWFDHNYRSLVEGPRHRRQAAQAAQAAPAEAQEAEEAAEEAAEADAAPAEAREREARQSALRAGFMAHMTNLILLDLIMPNGKKLRHCTREEISEDADWKIRLRDRLQPGQTPEDAGMTEEEALDLL